jgi:hypothetical protein
MIQRTYQVMQKRCLCPTKTCGKTPMYKMYKMMS